MAFELAPVIESAILEYGPIVLQQGALLADKVPAIWDKLLNNTSYIEKTSNLEQPTDNYSDNNSNNNSSNKDPKKDKDDKESKNKNNNELFNIDDFEKELKKLPDSKTVRMKEIRFKKIDTVEEFNGKVEQYVENLVGKPIKTFSNGNGKLYEVFVDGRKYQFSLRFKSSRLTESGKDIASFQLPKELIKKYGIEKIKFIW